MYTIERIECNVGEQDILMGQMCSADFCPVAIALRRLLKMAGIYRSVRVWHATIEIMGKMYEMPKEVKDFITLYDNIQTKENAKPFKFKMVVNRGDNQSGPEESNTGSGV